MSLEFVRKLPTPTEIREQYPLSARATEIKNSVTLKSQKSLPGIPINFLLS